MADEGPKYKKHYEKHKDAHHTKDTIIDTTKVNLSKAYMHALHGTDDDPGVARDKKGRMDLKKLSEDEDKYGERVGKAGKRFKEYLLEQLEDELNLDKGTLKDKEEYHGLALQGFYNITEEGFKEMTDKYQDNFSIDKFEKERKDFLQLIEARLTKDAMKHLNDLYRDKKEDVIKDIADHTGVKKYMQNYEDMPFDLAVQYLNIRHDKEKKGIDNPKLNESEAKDVLERLNRVSEGKFSGLEKLLFKKKKKDKAA
ncbi:hypothetical protein GF361_03620 [Candidatus Woesearchaeota archaeon]|nr:hypothetical protein [Candidatus Woesearchaeota archaeon]